MTIDLGGCVIISSKLWRCVFFLALIMFFGCQPSSLEDFQLEGASHMRFLLEDLREIRHREDLARVEPLLRKRFEEMTDLMIRALEFQQKHPDMERAYLVENQALSELLQEEMQRVYALEGGKECIEKAQREAMLRLDAKEKIKERLQHSSHKKN